MYETSKLRGRIVEKFGSQIKFANAVGCSLSFLSQYLNGRKKLDQPTMEKWMIALEIDPADIYEYFFIGLPFIAISFWGFGDSFFFHKKPP